MIDFTNKDVFKLKEDEGYARKVEGLLADDEIVVGSYKSLRDGIVFTNTRIIAINTKGLTGSTVDYSSIPYSKISLYSVETAGTWEKMKILGADSELQVFIPGHGSLHFEFRKDVKIKEISKYITQYLTR